MAWSLARPLRPVSKSWGRLRVVSFRTWLDYDRAAIESERMRIKNVSEALGAEISDIDLAKPLSEDDEALIHQTFLERSVLVFRDQNLSPPEQVKVAR
ncbi:MAG TPA: hypothetical protein DCS82_06080, partial [Rhodospirillaceae bacterium]|nr:hypothetical protein [Rhodospirillaceae bacterium]